MVNLRLFISFYVFYVLIGNQVFAQPFSLERIIIDKSNETINPKKVYTVDFDGDGDLDIISASGNRKLVSYENVDGLGTFSNQKLIDSGAPEGIILHITDLDGEGDQDLLINGYNKAGVVWYENIDGKGTYDVLQPITNKVVNLKDIHTGDIDGDGDTDIIVASDNPGRISWFENLDSTDLFSEAKVIKESFGELFGVRLVDFDSDDDLDVLAVSSESPGMIWYENIEGTGTFQKGDFISEDSTRITEAQIIDIEGDGDLDVFAIGEGQLLWYENVNRAGSFERYFSLTTSTENNRCFLTKDVDGDQDVDLLVGSYLPSQLKWFKHIKEEQIFSEQAEVEIGFIDVKDIVSGDIDTDGDLDLVYASSFIFDNIAWCSNLDGRGRFGKQKILSQSATGLRAVHAADIDGDGKEDILSASFLDGKLAWYKQLDENGLFGRQIIFGKSSATDISTADFDGDGDLDVLSPDIDWYENVNGDLSVKHKVSSDVAGVRSVKAADLDGDGDKDILAASFLDDEIVWFENIDGLGSFGPLQLIDSLVYSVNSLFPVDLDGDGDLDVVSGSSSFSSVVWHENIDGQGQFGTPNDVSMELATVNSVFAADLDGDGDSDILAASGLDRKIVWFENLNGRGSFSNQQLITRNADGPIAVYAKDLDSDGDIDILSASSNDAKIAWYENLEGKAAFGEQAIISNNSRGAVSVYATDLDSDGAIDVLSASANDNKVAWYKNLRNKILFEDLGHFTLYQNRPNPLSESTIIGFIVPDNMEATFNFYDMSGRLFYIIKGEFVKGYNQIKVDRSELPIFGPAVVYYQLVSGDQHAAKKMFLID